MNKEHAQFLINNYPWFFESCKSEPVDSCHTPAYLFGIECDDGWYELLYDLFAELGANVVEQSRIDLALHPERTEIYENWPQVTQIKEKFGGLCFYINETTDEQRKIIRKYVNKSYHTCETCGDKGKLRNHYNWYLTACKPCFKEILAKHYRNSTYWEWYWWNLKRTVKWKSHQYYHNIEYTITKLFKHAKSRKNR